MFDKSKSSKLTPTTKFPLKKTDAAEAETGEKNRTILCHSRYEFNGASCQKIQLCIKFTCSRL